MRLTRLSTLQLRFVSLAKRCVGLLGGLRKGVSRALFHPEIASDSILSLTGILATFTNLNVASKSLVLAQIF